MKSMKNIQILTSIEVEVITLSIKSYSSVKIAFFKELMFFIEKNNMKTIDITGLIYNPMIGEWSLNKNLTKINYFFTAEKI